ncbi:MAG: trypsin-like peptidase domain-containing protein, partial [Phycisphaerae bacterium]
MNRQQCKSTGRTVLVVLAAAVAATAMAGPPDRPVKRAAMERAVGGITRAQRIAMQEELLTQLEAVMPQAALNEPVRVVLDDQDRADLEAPYQSGTPLKIGVVKSFTPGIELPRGRELKAGVIEEGPDGERTWAASFESPGAQAVRLHLENFSLPAGAEMYFFSPDGGAYGPFTGKGRNGNGDFWTRSIASDTVVVQLHFNEADLEKMTFTITELGHINGRRVPQISKDDWPCGDNVACLVDATCADRGPAEPAKDAIAKMEWIVSPYIYTCTGGLLADTDAGSQIPYFLTANHCDVGDTPNLETFFNYTTDSCNGTCPGNLVFGGTPPPSDTVGTTLVVKNATSDFCLLTLNEDPPAGAVFLGWNNSPVAFTNGEPLYRISNANYGPQVYSQQDVDTTAGTCTGLSRGNIIYSNNNVGGTMGGSSGSPVVNSAGEVVGQLYGCCGTNCANDCDYASNSTIDGAFAVTWSWVEDYLDPPVVSCNSDPECDDGLYCNGAETCVSQVCQAGTDPCGGDPCDESTDTCSTLQYSWNLNSNPGWSTQGLWAYGQPTGGGGQHGNPDPTSGATGSNVYGYNLSGDYENNLPETHLTTTAIDCSGLTGVTLVFQRWLGVEQPTYDHAYVRVSNNGSSWTTIWENFNEVADGAWGLQSYDISSVADDASTVYIRWTMGTTDTSWQYCGWNIDDIEIWGAGGGPECTIPADCDDGLYCNGAEDCVSGSCVAGTPPNCNDGVGCTDDSCNEGTDSCDNVPNDGSCSDGLYCNGAETCHATLDCQSGTAPNCNDGVGCTDDSCNEGTDSCDNVPDDGNCDDGAYCNGAETCHATLDCQAGSDPCVGFFGCDEINDLCVECFDNGDCDDGAYCNGAETCDGLGVCQNGTAVDCDDGVGCTDDSCNEGTDSCDNVANDGNCDDGLYCNGDETCHATLDCQAGTAVDCDDGVDCTSDSCNEAGDSCNHTPDDGYCSDGLYCNGAEVCNATLDCQPGTAVDCEDGVGCTDDSCNEGTDSCDNVANDAYCPDDGLYCNGTEYCHATADCSSTGDPCAPLGCNETTDMCESVECTVPADCDDGSDCTVDDCIDNVCYNDCPTTVSSYPYTEGFESGFGDWANVGGDDIDWTRDSGGTPSNNTGPSSAHGGTWYVYTEASSPNYPNMTAILEGPCFDLSGTSDADMTFWYHMYGSAMGTLNVEVSEDCIVWDNVWSLSGNQGNNWLEASVDLSAYAGSTITIRFRGVTGTSYTSDMTVDDITVDVTPAIPCSGDPECDDGVYCNGAEFCGGGFCQPGSDPCPLQGCDEVLDVCTACGVDADCDDGNDCTVDTCVGGVCFNDCANTVSSYPYNEGWESGFGDWVNASGDDIDWTRDSGGTPSSGTGPSAAHGGTWYVYTEASSPNYPNMTAILEGPCFDFTATSDEELSFWYHMYGSAMGTLYVEVSEDCVDWDTVWSLSGNQGNSWFEAVVDLSAYSGTTVTIRFRGVTGTSYTSDMTVDDVSVTATAGPVCTIPADCDDGLYCNGVEDCVGGNCVPGTAVDCSDGVGCTDDTCNEATDSCDHVANDANCADGQYCNGDETCHATLDCQAGTAVDCADSVDCTIDSCNEGTDSCDNTPDHGFCSDGQYCNGAEVCNVTLDCQSGSAVDCDDGVGCTDDSCNEGTDSCDNIANDGNCPDDGLYCNGTEYCDAVSDCSSTGDPCGGGEICNEGTDTCDPGSAAKMEAGTLTVGSGYVGVSLDNTYASPVIVCSVQYDNNTIPVVPRISSVTSTSFDIRLQAAASSGTVVADTVNCLVVEEGVWTVDGVNIEAQTYNSTVTDQNNSWGGQAQSYGQSYSNPVVIGQVMSENDADWSVFWCRGTSKNNPPTASTLYTGKTVCEDPDATRANETVGFIVFERGPGT